MAGQAFPATQTSPAIPAASSAPARRVSPLLSRLLLLALSLCLPLLALELGFRTIGPFLPGDYELGDRFEFDPLLGWRYRPNIVSGTHSPELATVFAVNQQGLRDEDVSYDKPAAGFRILALGDSFLAASEVALQATVAKQLQSLLRSALVDRPVDVVNAGVQGYGTTQEYLYLDSEGYKYHPDVVLLLVFLGNDPIDNIRSSAGSWERPVFDLDDNGRLGRLDRPERGADRSFTLDKLLLSRSMVYSFFRTGVLTKLGRSGSDDAETRDLMEDFPLYERNASSKVQRAWEVTEALIQASATRSDEIGARLVVVATPTSRQLDPPRFRQQLLEHRLDPAKYDVQLSRARLSQIATRLNLAYLDLLPALAEASAQEPMYFPKGLHWTAAGHRIAAQAIQDFLISRSIARPG